MQSVQNLTLIAYSPRRPRRSPKTREVLGDLLLRSRRV